MYHKASDFKMHTLSKNDTPTILIYANLFGGHTVYAKCSCESSFGCANPLARLSYLREIGNT